MGKKPNARSITLDMALRQQGYDVKHHAANPEEIRVCCPFCVQNGHNADSKYRLGINMRTGQAHCFNCSWKTGDIYGLLQKAAGVPVRANDDYYEETDKKAKPRAKLPDEFYPLTGQTKGSAIGRRAYSYLMKRGVQPWQIERHNIGYCPNGYYGYRVVFPIYRKGRLMTFIARDFTGKQEPRFLNMPGEKPLWGVEQLEQARKIPRHRPRVVMYEGIFKALAGEAALGENDKTVHVATLGSHITELQLRDLRPEYTGTVILFPDPNAVGLEGYLEIGNTLIGRGHHPEVVYPFPDAEADELRPSQVRDLVWSSVPVTGVKLYMAFEAAKRRGV